MSAGRNDNMMVENARVSFAMYCDMNNLTLEDRLALADLLAQEIEFAAEESRWQEGVLSEEAGSA